MKLVMTGLLAITLWAGGAGVIQSARADEVIVSPSITQNVQPVQWRRYRYYPRYYGWGGGYYRPYYSYRPYYDGGAFYYGPWGGGVYFSW
jgi:hypothetical protein